MTVLQRSMAFWRGRHKAAWAARAALLLTLGLVVACSSDDEREYVERPVEDIYNEAHATMLANDYFEAAELFDEVERQHPYSTWATKAQLMAAYSYYKINEYDQAILAADRFLQLHPGNESAPYAFYLIAVSYYEQIADVGRDQNVTKMALGSLQELVRRYPASEYARDARLKIDLARDHLAGKEMEIGRFYLRRGTPIAAINRFRVVIEDFQTTSHAAEALHRLTEAYLQLGVTKEAQTAAAVLGHNFPGSPWYQDSYLLLTGVDLRPQGDPESWITKTWKKVF
ncbi:MAG TPA: outer membrane protein assembly factor BamD [Alphaproteobacteria bacterium]|jgi:outer membrane protein assembly factor BamD|nr:outer membrane protein assembly factor BamD [Alphaproteobacteria bacterium]MDP7428312.1 outer membrane protein assembly factor BamD [Alphaproteobacteria bacterium]HJM51771.1 outer membrane protein assembly factor BamD [Alphaproteobacteria bacterium]